MLTTSKKKRKKNTRYKSVYNAKPSAKWKNQMKVGDKGVFR